MDQKKMCWITQIFGVQNLTFSPAYRISRWAAGGQDVSSLWLGLTHEEQININQILSLDPPKACPGVPDFLLRRWNLKQTCGWNRQAMQIIEDGKNALVTLGANGCPVQTTVLGWINWTSNRGHHQLDWTFPACLPFGNQTWQWKIHYQWRFS